MQSYNANTQDQNFKFYIIQVEQISKSIMILVGRKQIYIYNGSSEYEGAYLIEVTQMTWPQ